MSWKNPFRLVNTSDGLAYQAGLPDGPGIAVFDEADISTLVAIHNVEIVADVLSHEPGHISGTVVMKLPGLWAPPPGTLIQVGEPNRDVVVIDVRYQIDPGGFAAIVYVSDSQAS